MLRSLLVTSLIVLFPVVAFAQQQRQITPTEQTLNEYASIVANQTVRMRELERQLAEANEELKKLRPAPAAAPKEEKK